MGSRDPSRWGTDQGDPADERVLLLLQPGRDRELFAERLAGHDVVVAEPEPGEPLPAFDLCLVDTATYAVVEGVLAERKAESRTYLPVLLVVGPDEDEGLIRTAADVADDVLSLPTSEPVLRSRVGSLMRARRGSLALDAERERFRTLAETAPSAIVTMDAAGIVQYANPGVESVFDYRPEDIVGERLTMLLPPAMREAHTVGLSRYLETGERNLDWQGTRLPGLHADGHEIPLLVSFAEHRTGGERRFTGILQDITEHVEREDQLAQVADLLSRTQAIADVGGWELDPESETVEWTDQVHAIFDREFESDLPVEEAVRHYHFEDRSVIRDAVDRAMTEGESFDIELRIERPDGDIRWVRARGEPVRENGVTEAIRGAVQDITERKERQTELERTLDLLDRTQRMADVAGWEVDAETLEVTWTDQLFDILGIPVGEDPPLDEALEFYHPEDRPRIEAAIAAALESGEPFDLDLRIQRADGKIRWVRTAGEAVTVDGEVETFRGTFQDITGRKEREQELERYETVLETVPEAAWILDEELEVVFADTSAAEGVGLTREGIIGRPTETFRTTLFPDETAYEEYVAAAEAVLAGERESAEVVTELTLEDGPAIIEIGLSPLVRDGTIEGVVGLAREISGRVERERELEQAVEQLRQTRDIANVSGWEYDPRSDEIWWDEKVWDIYGQPASFEPTAETVLALYESGSRAQMESVMERAVVEAEPFDIEIELDTEPTRWVRVTGSPKVEDGKTVAVRGVVRDITRRKRREEFLERHERIVETASDPIYTLDGGLRFTLANTALADLFDRDRESLLGEHVSSVFDDAHAEALGDAATKLYARSDGEPITLETTVTDSLGRARRFQTAVSPKGDPDGLHGLVCVSHDVSDVTEHERRLSVLDRVLRHNLRNKMNVVLARAQSIQERAGDEATVEVGASIEAAAEELLGLSEAARKFHDALDPSQTDLTEVEDIAEHAAHVVEATPLSYDEATIEADLPETAPAMATAEFELALSELVDNAVTHGGPETTVRIEVESVGNEVVVRVIDDGPGIPSLERRALEAGWESPLQHATGLGLWFVQWTVRNSGGTMHIEDREGGGSIVELRLPAGESEA